MSTSPISSISSINLQNLHDRYVAAINVAVSQDDLALVDELSAHFENEALELISAAA